MPFLLRASPRKEAARAEARPAFEEVEITDAIFQELGCGRDRGGTVIGLHQDGAKSIGAPICLQEGGLAAVISGEARAGGNASFDFVKQRRKGQRPFVNGNRLAVEALNEKSERFQADFKPGAVFACCRSCTVVLASGGPGR
jgi:hypothetical protein